MSVSVMNKHQEGNLGFALFDWLMDCKLAALFTLLWSMSLSLMEDVKRGASQSAEDMKD